MITKLIKIECSMQISFAHMSEHRFWTSFYFFFRYHLSEEKNISLATKITMFSIISLKKKKKKKKKNCRMAFPNVRRG